VPATDSSWARTPKGNSNIFYGTASVPCDTTCPAHTLGMNASSQGGTLRRIHLPAHSTASHPQATPLQTQRSLIPPGTQTTELNRLHQEPPTSRRNSKSSTAPSTPHLGPCTRATTPPRTLTLHISQAASIFKMELRGLYGCEWGWGWVEAGELSSAFMSLYLPRIDYLSSFFALLLLVMSCLSYPTFLSFPPLT
jgi:hypothetical protein